MDERIELAKALIKDLQRCPLNDFESKVVFGLEERSWDLRVSDKEFALLKKWHLKYYKN